MAPKFDQHDEALLDCLDQIHDGNEVSDTSHLGDVLQRWILRPKTDFHTDVFAYPLNQYFADEVLSTMPELKDRDLVLMTQLRGVCKDLNLYLCLANMIQVAKTGNNGKLSSKADSCAASKFVDSEPFNLFDSVEVALEIPVPVNAHYFQSTANLRPVDDIKKSKVTINRTVILIMPLQHKLRFFCQKDAYTWFYHSQNRRSILRKLHQKSSSNDAGPQLREEMLMVCKHMAKQYEQWDVDLGKLGDYEDNLNLLRSICILKDEFAFASAISLVFYSIRTFDQSKEMIEYSGREQILKFLDSWIDKVPEACLEAKIAFIERVAPLLYDSSWEKDQYVRCLTSSYLGQKGHGPALATIAKKWATNDEMLREVLLPAIRKHASSAHFLLEFLRCAPYTPKYVFQELLPLSLPHFNVRFTDRQSYIVDILVRLYHLPEPKSQFHDFALKVLLDATSIPHPDFWRCSAFLVLLRDKLTRAQLLKALPFSVMFRRIINSFVTEAFLAQGPEDAEVVDNKHVREFSIFRNQGRELKDRQYRPDHRNIRTLLGDTFEPLISMVPVVFVQDPASELRGAIDSTHDTNKAEDKVACQSRALDTDTAIPSWFTLTLAKIKESYPDVSFEGTMTLCYTDTRTNLSVYVPEGQPVPSYISVRCRPTINCSDCTVFNVLGNVELSSDCGADVYMKKLSSHIKSAHHDSFVNDRAKYAQEMAEPRGPLAHIARREIAKAKRRRISEQADLDRAV